MSGKAKRILVVDDNMLDAKLLAAQLHIEKYQTMIVTSGKEALQTVSAESPDLILLDVLMPEMDGYEVTKRLKQDSRTMNIPVILVTGLDGEDDKVKGMEAGADEFLNKPVNRTELIARVRSLLTLKQFKEQLLTRNLSRNLIATPLSQKDPKEKRKILPTVLLVGNDEMDANLIRSYLGEDSYNVEIVKHIKEAMAVVSERDVDMILLDVTLATMDDLALLRPLKEVSTKTLQILAITCLKGVESKFESIKHGADDFLVKPIHGEELRTRVNAALRRKADLDQLRSELGMALEAAITDKLTGLYNHAYFKHFLETEMKRSQRQKHPLSLIMMDIDDFKRLNDTMGHLFGDEVLREVGQLIGTIIRSIDLAARCGGDEFAVVLPYTEQKEAEEVAERIREGIAEGLFQAGCPLPQNLTMSLGVAELSRKAQNVQGLIQAADWALYLAKKEGKNTVRLFQDFKGSELHVGRFS